MQRRAVYANQKRQRLGWISRLAEHDPPPPSRGVLVDTSRAELSAPRDHV